MITINRSKTQSVIRQKIAAPVRRLSLCGLLAVMPVFSGPDVVFAAPQKGKSPAGTTNFLADPPAPTGSVVPVRSHKFTFRQLGATFPLQLQGIQGLGGVNFSVRRDEVVTGARLHLNYSYSPALLPAISHLRVLVNEQVIATIPVPNEQGGKPLQRVIDIPSRLIGEFNRLNIQLIGHYTMECEDPAHSSLWANVGNDSVLELSVSPLSMVNDLAFLPEPFFDRRDPNLLTLPIVFARTPDAAQLEAAGTVTSWFGSLAGFRGASFPVSVGQIPPKGHAVVLMLGGNEGALGLGQPVANGPTVTVTAHPSDPTAKLLLISGRDAKELKRVALALAVGNPALTGPSATITEFKPSEARKPYDAPRWIASDRPVKVGELVQNEMLSVSGYSPDLIRIDFQVPPDLFTWREGGIPVNLKYRYTARPTTDKSTLNINVNEQFLRALPLRTADHSAPGTVENLLKKAIPVGDLLPAEDFFRVPLFKIPARSQLQFHYYHDMPKQGACKDVILDNMRGTVEPDSTIDISGFSHFLAMPDLAAFGNSGFPFTRLADLSESAVVLPASPELDDYSAYLTLMGLMGNVTGYPAHAVTVLMGSTGIKAVADKDLLVLASGANSPLLTQWAEYLPFSLKPEAKRFRLSEYAFGLMQWWNRGPDRASPKHSEVVFSSANTEAVIAGLESPLKSGRSVVLLASQQAAGLQQAVAALINPNLLKNIQGSVVLVRGEEVDSVTADQTYYISDLGFINHMQLWLSKHPLMLLLLGVAAASMIGALLYISLRNLAKIRLKQQTR